MSDTNEDAAQLLREDAARARLKEDLEMQRYKTTILDMKCKLVEKRNHLAVHALFVYMSAVM